MKGNKVIVHALIKVGDKFLLTKRSKYENYCPEYWDLPGGKVEDVELPKDGVIRETKEETNLDIVPNKIIREDSNYDKEKDLIYIRLIYYVELDNIDNIKLDLNEHSEYRLINNIEELNGDNTFDFIKELIKEYV